MAKMTKTDKVLFLEGVEPVGQSREPAQTTHFAFLSNFSLELFFKTYLSREIEVTKFWSYRHHKRYYEPKNAQKTGVDSS